MENRNWQGKAAVYGIVVLLAVLTCIIMPVNYNVNDDVDLEYILSGSYTGTPDGHAIYIQALLSYPLSWLYRLFPGWNWYGILLYSLQWLGLALILERINEGVAGVGKHFLVSGNVLLVFFIAIWENYVSLTYTMTAGILLAAVMFWYAAGDNSLYVQAVTAFLVLVGVSLRIQFLPVVLVPGIICWALKLYKEGIQKAWQLPLMVISGLLVMAVCQYLAYGSQEWKDFLEFNEARTEVYDYTGVPAYEENREFYDRMGPGQQIFEALDIYDLTGRPEITAELLLSVADYQKEKQALPVLDRIKEAFRISGQSLFRDQYGKSLFPLNAMMLVIWTGFILISIRQKKYEYLLSGAAVLLAMGAMWFYLAWKGRLLYRILFIMQLLMITTGAGLWKYSGIAISPDWKVRQGILTASAMVMLVPAVLTGRGCYARVAEMREQNKDRKILEQYFEEHPQQFYLLTTPLVAPITGELSLRNESHPMNYAELGGWVVRSPLYDCRLEQAGIQDLREMLLDQKGYVVTSGRDMSYLFSDVYTEGEAIEYRSLEYLSGWEQKYYIHQYIQL